jgi:hypothetical protein
LRKVVFRKQGVNIINFIRLAIQTIAIFAISFGPFIYVGGME